MACSCCSGTVISCCGVVLPTTVHATLSASGGSGCSCWTGTYPLTYIPAAGDWQSGFVNIGTCLEGGTQLVAVLTFVGSGTLGNCNFNIQDQRPGGACSNPFTYQPGSSTCSPLNLVFTDTILAGPGCGCPVFSGATLTATVTL